MTKTQAAILLVCLVAGMTVGVCLGWKEMGFAAFVLILPGAAAGGFVAGMLMILLNLVAIILRKSDE